jgi:subtilisin family serine protease
MLKASTASERQTHGHQRRLRHIPGVVVIRWKDDTIADSAARAGGRTAARALPSQVTDRLAYLRSNFGLKRVVDLSAGSGATPVLSARRGAAHAIHAVANSLAPGRGSLRGLTVVELADRADTQKAASALRHGPVAYAQPAPARWAAKQTSTTTDARYNGQWGLPAIDWFNAARRSASKVRIAVLDSGVDRSHPDLKRAIQQYWTMGFSSADLLGHGTHVAGIIAALTNNKIGIAGVTDSKLMCWKVFEDKAESDGELYLNNTAYYRALDALTSKRAIRVVNLSISGVEEDKTERALLEGIIQKDRILIVAAMGNEYEKGNPIEYPAAIPGVLAVGAIGEKRTRARFSNTGKHIGLVAPGESILSTVPLKPSKVREDTEYASWDGTSFATPFVVGAAAYVFATRPSLSAKEARDLILQRTNRLTGMRKSSHTTAYGSGLLNLRKLLASSQLKRKRKRRG